jgi:hypothetical protein
MRITHDGYDWEVEDVDSKPTPPLVHLLRRAEEELPF